MAYKIVVIANSCYKAEVPKLSGAPPSRLGNVGPLGRGSCLNERHTYFKQNMVQDNIYIFLGTLLKYEACFIL
jgi:hypothetical protein